MFPNMPIGTCYRQYPDLGIWKSGFKSKLSYKETSLSLIYRKDVDDFMASPLQLMRRNGLRM